MASVAAHFSPSFARLMRKAAHIAFIASAFLIATLGAHPAHAQVSTLGAVFCTAADNIMPFASVFNWFAYVAGGFLIVQGVIHLKSHYDNPNQNPMHRIIAMLTAGCFLTILPSFIGMLIDTLFISAETNGVSASTCMTNAGAAGGGPVPLDLMLQNFVANIRMPLTVLVTFIAVVLGIFLVVRGLLKASKYGTDPRAASITSIASNLIVGTILIVLGQSIDTIAASITGETLSGSGFHTFSDLSWTAIDSTGVDTTGFKRAIEAALTFFQLVGLIAFVRGWNVIRNAVEGVGQATVAQGITHIVGGVLAINIYTFIMIMDKTFGTNFVS